MAMDIHVYDTYVKAKDGHTMHFDVITDVQDHDKAIEYAKTMASNNWRRWRKGDRRGMPILSHTRSTRTSRKRNQRKGILHSKKWKDAHKLFF